METRKIIFERDGNYVFHVPGKGDRAVVSFPSRNVVPMDQPAFAERFLTRRNIPGFYIWRPRSDWFQGDDIPDMMAAIRDATSGFREVIAYGSSMGGYGALRFASAIGAKRAVSMVPLYSIQPEKVPFETRWEQDAAQLIFQHDDMTGAWEGVDAYVMYDPTHIDRRHVELLRERGAFRELRFPHAGHSIGLMLSEMKLLSRLVLDLFDGKASWPDMRREMRARRTASSYFMNGLCSRAYRRNRMALAKYAGEAAWRLEPSPRNANSLARICEKTKDHAQAYELLAGLSRDDPQNIEFIIRLSIALYNLKRFPEAAAHLQGALAHASDHRLHWNLSGVMVMMANPSEALRHAEAARDLGMSHPALDKRIEDLRRRLEAAGQPPVVENT
jgi:hypothetical protein